MNNCYLEKLDFDAEKARMLVVKNQGKRGCAEFMNSNFQMQKNSIVLLSALLFIQLACST